MIYALVPAGGQSTRMGRPKMLLPLGGRTVIEHILVTLHESGIQRILVVGPPHLPELRELTEASGGDVLVLTGQTPGMRETVEAGLTWIEAHWQPNHDDAWLLQPGDHPSLTVDVVASLLAAREAHPLQTLFIPTYQGRRGHPTLIGWTHVAGLRPFPSGQGLNAYIRSHAAAAREVPVANERILRDLDTPDDYERLLKETWESAQGGS